jgi:hypothetical protein
MIAGIRRHEAGALLAVLLVFPAAGAPAAVASSDFSGQWGRAMLHFEQPPSGPGPIANTMRRKDGTMDQESWVGDFNDPILKPEAAAIVKKRGEIALRGLAAPDPHNQCRPEPTPFTMSTQFGMQFVQQENKIVLLYLGNHQVRHVRLNDTHPAKVIPTWHGDSVARYEGDALVIDTVGVKLGPLPIVDLYGMPYTEALHVVERYRLIDGEAALAAQAKHEGEPGGCNSQRRQALDRSGDEGFANRDHGR